MGFNIKCLILLNVLFNALAFDEGSTKLLRIDRKNDGSYQPLPPRDYGVTGNQKDDSIHGSEQASYNNKPQSGGDYPLFNEYNINGQLSNYGLPSFSSFSPDHKGYPFPVPSWITPDQLMQMMAAINNVANATKPEGTGLFSKLIIDSKIAAAAFVPLSIVAAAIVPVLMNYMMGYSAPPTISTTANNRGFRIFDVTTNFDEILENFARFSRAMDNDECIQKTICRVVIGDADAPNSEYVKKVASAISQLVEGDWSDNIGIKEIVNGVKNGKCSNICKHSARLPETPSGQNIWYNYHVDSL
ncbi:uncharacterized protein TNCT_302921 [Trichonephila clavata]|uniref:Uncharacterized protein n=1 Tax=Trichonephila clavata TaxID=2740835 RepID=A0A8X6HEU5_TRICU|nr:uncharacterized protein TNCT_302921 [Trichonephila clavata]